MKFFYYILFLCSVSSYSQNIIIGDSQVAFLDIHITKAQRVNSLWKPGITVNDLTMMVQNYPLSTTVKNVIISIGTNDRYTGDVKVTPGEYLVKFIERNDIFTDQVNKSFPDTLIGIINQYNYYGDEYLPYIKEMTQLLKSNPNKDHYIEDIAALEAISKFFA